jgi:hypothetical protein
LVFPIGFNAALDDKQDFVDTISDRGEIVNDQLGQGRFSAGTGHARFGR